MKKTIILYAILCVATICNAQECKEVKKQLDEMEGTIKWESPTTMLSPKIKAVRIIKDQKETGFIYMAINWPVSNYVSKGIFIKLDDETFIREENIDVTCTYNSSLKMWLYSAYLPMTEVTYEKLSKNKMVTFKLGIAQNDIGDKFASKFIGYLPCVFESK